MDSNQQNAQPSGQEINLNQQQEQQTNETSNQNQIQQTIEVQQQKEIIKDPKKFVQYGDTIVFYISQDIIKIIEVKQGGEFTNFSGTFTHDSIVGKPYGSKVFPKGKGLGVAYILQLTSNIITEQIDHKTQILYQSDIAFIIQKLNILPGTIVVESGTGSGSLSSSILQTLMGEGHLYTFEFNEGRVQNNRELFKKFKFQNVTVTWRDVLQFGFLPNADKSQQQQDSYDLLKSDCVFLDLPRPYEAIIHAKQILKQGGRICCFSPCIEQVQKNSLALRDYGFIQIETFEILKRDFEFQQCQFKQLFDVNQINVKRTHEEAIQSDKVNAPVGQFQQKTITSSMGQQYIKGHTGYLTFAILQ